MGARQNAFREANRGDCSQIRGLEGVSHNTFVSLDTLGVYICFMDSL